MRSFKFQVAQVAHSILRLSLSPHFTLNLATTAVADFFVTPEKIVPNAEIDTSFIIRLGWSSVGKFAKADNS